MHTNPTGTYNSANPAAAFHGAASLLQLSCIRSPDHERAHRGAPGPDVTLPKTKDQPAERILNEGDALRMIYRDRSPRRIAKRKRHILSLATT